MPPGAAPADSLIRAGETHFAHLWQLTFGGENAEAYWSADGRQLIFQSTRDGWPCDQEYVLDLGTGAVTPRQHRQGPHHLRLLLRQRPAHAVLLDPPRRRLLPAAARLLPGLRLAGLPGLRHLHRAPDGSRPEAAHATRPATTPRARSRPTASGSCSPRCATATSSCTRCSTDGSGVTRLTDRARLRRRRVLLARRQVDLLARATIRPTPAVADVPRAARAAPGAADRRWTCG